MAADFIPAKEADLVTWSNNFNTLITASATTYGLTAGDAVRFSADHSTFISAYQTSQNPSTRTPSAVIAKNNARDEMVELARELARIVQATPSVTDQQKSDLGLTVRDDEPSPIDVPEFAPGIQIVSAIGRTVKIRLWDTENPDTRGKPDGVDGATVLSYIGSAPPAPEDIEDWKFEGNISRTTTNVTFDGSVPSGSTVWFTAFWFNPRKQSGPPSQPVSAQIPGSLSQAA